MIDPDRERALASGDAIPTTFAEADVVRRSFANTANELLSTLDMRHTHEAIGRIRKLATMIPFVSLLVREEICRQERDLNPQIAERIGNLSGKA